MSTKDVLSKQELHEHLQQLTHWRELPGSIAAVFQTKTSAAAIELFGDIASAAEMANHHPDVDWRYNLVFVTTSSHDAGGVPTLRDIALATKISECATALGATSRPELISAVEIAIDTDEVTTIAEQWSTGLGYKQQEDHSLTDPNRGIPAIWFQSTPTPNANRLHLDIWKPYSEIESVLQKLEAQNLSLDHADAPSFVVATDQQGNRFCICTEVDG